MVELDLSSNNLRDVPSLPDCGGLMRLVLNSNPIPHIPRRAFLPLRSLTTLELSNNGIEIIENVSALILLFNNTNTKCVLGTHYKREMEWSALYYDLRVGEEINKVIILSCQSQWQIWRPLFPELSPFQVKLKIQTTQAQNSLILVTYTLLSSVSISPSFPVIPIQKLN